MARWSWVAEEVGDGGEGEEVEWQVMDGEPTGFCD